MKRKFRVGERIPASGIYTVFHSIHRVNHQVTLVEGELFPPCSKCSDQVEFRLLKSVPEIDADYPFRIRLFQIPHPATNRQLKEQTA